MSKLYCRCKDSVEFSLECCWLLDAYGTSVIRKFKKKSHGHRLRQAILNEFRDGSHGAKIPTKPPAFLLERPLRSRSEASTISLFYLLLCRSRLVLL